MNSLVAIPATSLDQSRGQWFFAGAIALSLLLHATLGVALIDGVERRLPAPDAEEPPVMVDLVPPPEQDAAEVPEAPDPLPQPEAKQLTEEPQRTLNRVIEYGETDTGPKTNQYGVSAQQPDETEAEPLEVPDGETAETAIEQESDQPEAPEAEAESEPEAEAGEVADADAAPDNVAGAETSSENADGAEAAADEADTARLDAVLVTPKSRPARKRRGAARKKAGRSGSAPRGNQLQSRKLLSGPRTVTSMIGVPRPQRVNDLCMTEMRVQLLAERPPRLPEYLPEFYLTKGNILQPRLAAFRSSGRWFDFKMRCEVDNDATKVVNFRYSIGRSVPRAEWAARRFPRF